MNELRWDPLAGRWAVVAPDRAGRPHQNRPAGPGPCPFCPGNEHLTPPPVVVVGDPWQVRVVPNRYPALSPDLPLPFPGGEDRDTAGVAGATVPAHGRHEVVVPTPVHGVAFHELDDEALGVLGPVVADRVAAYAADPGVLSSQLFVNQGVAGGASLPHAHLQLVALPLVPPVLAAEQRSVGSPGDCALCRLLPGERAAGERVVFERDATVALCPHWSGTSYEVLVLPDDHVGAPVSWDLALRALRDAGRLVARRHPGVSYNVVVHTGTLRGAGASFHWHGHVLPRLGALAGFELGTGMGITTVTPERAAAELRVHADAPPTR